MSTSDFDIQLERGRTLQAFIDQNPFARKLGMRCDIKGDQMIATLPFQEKLIGNAAIQALHGGAIGSFLELTAMAQVYLQSDLENPPRPINVTIDYLRQGRASDLYAHARLNKLGRRMASVRAEAWQSEFDRPVAALNAHFIVSSEG